MNNFDIINIHEVKHLFRALIIFSKNRKINFYYQYMYLYENNRFHKINDENEILNTKILFKKSKNVKKNKK